MPIKATTSAVKITEKNDRNAALIIDGIDSDSVIFTVSNSGRSRDGYAETESMIMEWDDVRALIDALTALADEYDSENDDDDDNGTSGADSDSYISYMPETDGVTYPDDGLRTVSTTTTTTTTTVRERPR